MNTTTFMTRHKSYEDMLDHLSERHKQILEILKDKELTTREIAQRLKRKGYTLTSDVNNARPRITELEKLGLVTADKAKKCKVTNKMVAVYRETTYIERMIMQNMNHIPRLD